MAYWCIKGRKKRISDATCAMGMYCSRQASGIFPVFKNCPYFKEAESLKELKSIIKQ